MTDAKTNHRTAAFSFADLEQDPADEPLGAQAPAGLDPRCSIRVHGRRHRLTDPSGASDKAAIDGLVLAGVLTDDSAKYIKEVTHSQEQIPKSQPEETLITLTWQ